MLELKKIQKPMDGLETWLALNFGLNIAANIFLALVFPATMISNIVYGNSR
jgi:hypothetical protein